MLRITTDGEGSGVKFIDTETGADLTQTLMVSYGATITLENYGKTTMRMQIILVEPDVTVNQIDWLTKHPLTGEIAPVEFIRFRDRTSISFAEDGRPTVATPLEEVGSPHVKFITSKP